MLGVVLAAGKGERMRPLSAERPKALLPTLDVPQLTWALARLKAAGVSRAWVNARRAGGPSGGTGGSEAAAAPEEGGDSAPEASIPWEARRAATALGLDVQVSLEPEEPLGTSGALSRLRAKLDQTFVLFNADVASSLPLERLVAAHQAAGAAATLVGIPTSDRADLVADDGWVVELVDRAHRSGAGYVYAGIGVFEPSVLGYVPDGVSHLFDTVMLGLFRDAGNRGMALFEWTGFWSDLADPAAYLRVNLEALGRSRSAGVPGVAGPQPITGPRSITGPHAGSEPQRVADVTGPMAGADALAGTLGPAGASGLWGAVQWWDELAYVGPGAEVADVELVRAVVGSGARVEPGTRLERCVVWDGAVVERGSYADAILTRRGVVDVSTSASGPASGSRMVAGPGDSLG